MAAAAAWLSMASAALLWPTDRAAPAAARVRQLVGDKRLAEPSPRRRFGESAPVGVVRRVIDRSDCVALGALLSGSTLALLVGLRHSPVTALEFGSSLAVAVAIGLSALRRHILTRRAGVRSDELALALSVIVAELAAGATPAAALRAAGGIGAEVAAGQPADDALARVTAAWRVSAAAGVPLADVLTQARADLRDRADADRELVAALAGPRSSAVLLAALPLFGIALGAGIGAQPLTVLFDTAGGRALLCVGVGLEALGVSWTQHLIARAAR